MELRKLFDIAIKAGEIGDSREREEIAKFLADKKENFDKMDDKEREYFDLEELTNPYADSSIFNDSGKDIKKVFVGVDAEVQEIILGDKLGVDLILGHHPEGKALLNLARVMEIHKEALIKSGVPVNVAERLVEERQEELDRGFHGVNYNRAVSAAKLLNISFANIHTPADNMANKFMYDFLASKEIKTVDDIIKSVLDIEEYQIAAKHSLKPKIISGSGKSRAGKIFVKFNGGTSGNKKIFKYLENSGISTFICMHLPENQLEEAKKHNINVVVMPHMASDSIGINLILDEIEKAGGEKLDIIAGSGFTRVERINK